MPERMRASASARDRRRAPSSIASAPRLRNSSALSRVARISSSRFARASFTLASPETAGAGKPGVDIFPDEAPLPFSKRSAFLGGLRGRFSPPIHQAHGGMADQSRHG